MGLVLPQNAVKERSNPLHPLFIRGARLEYAQMRQMWQAGTDQSVQNLWAPAKIFV